MKTLSSVPSFPAIWAAALSRPPVPRRDQLPEDVYRVERVRLDAERSARFDHLMGAKAADFVHPGLLHVLAFPVALSLMAQPRFPTPLLGLVHVKNQMLVHRPIAVNELVDVECRVQNLQPHRRGRTFEAVATISSGGEIIATDVSTYLARGNRGSAAAESASSGPAPAASSSDPAPAASSSGPAPTVPSPREEFRPPRPSARWKLGADAGRRYAAVSGDTNPIHMSALSAKLFGFNRAIAHGMYTASRAFSECLPDLSRPLRWDVEFAAPVMIPGTVWVAYDAESERRTEFVGYRAPRKDRPARKNFSGSVEILG